MRRRVARWFFVLVCGLIATALGVVSAILLLTPGIRRVARLINEQVHAMVRGSIHVGAVRGKWLEGFSLDSVVIRDSSGVLFAEIPHVELRYPLRAILGGRIILNSLRLTRPEIQIIKRRSNGRLNYQEIFRLGERPRGTGQPAGLIEVQNFEIEDGRVTIRLPWNPDGRLRTPRQVDSALAFHRSPPGRRIESGPEGLEIVRTLTGPQPELPRALLACPDPPPQTTLLTTLA